MPFTPFHMGVVAPIKIINKKVSLVVFGMGQIFMDIEAGLGLILGWDELHKFFHNIFGAFIISVILYVTYKKLGYKIIGKWNKEVTYIKLPWLKENSEMGNKVLWMNCLFATYSHIVLDSIMHYDVKIFYPISNVNFLAGYIEMKDIYMSCSVLIIIGFLGLFYKKYVNRNKINKY